MESWAFLLFRNVKILIMSKRIELLKIMAQGGFHSGEKLGQQLGISRSAIWKHIKALQEWQIDCYSVSGKGYSLAHPIELLSQKRLNPLLDAEANVRCSKLEILASTESTNSYLMGKIADGVENGHVCLAEYQTAGRGRRGRQWVSPFAQNIYLSFYWQFDLNPTVLGSLGLAIAVGVVRALKVLGIDDAQLKWPNDILWQGQKLAGILLEMKAEVQGMYQIVTGVGVNFNMDKSQSCIDQPWIDINCISALPLSRNIVASVLIKELLAVAQQFEYEGLSPFLQEWQQADAFAGQQIDIYLPDRIVSGTSQGIDVSGALVLDTDLGLQIFHSGDVSLRPAGVIL